MVACIAESVSRFMIPSGFRSDLNTVMIGSLCAMGICCLSHTGTKSCFKKSTNHQFICLLQILCRNRAVQLPYYIYRSAAIVSDIVGSPQERIRRSTGYICFEFTNKQNNFAPQLLVIDVSLSHRACISSGTLTLPVEQIFIDRIVIIHCCGRIILIGLVQRHKQHINLFVRQPLRALTDIARRHIIHSNQNLVTGIGTVQV